MLTDEQKAEIDAKLAAIFNKRKPPKPKVIASDGEIIRDAKVRVSTDDVNARNRGSEEVVVQRPAPEWLRHDRVRINMPEYERQRAERDWAEARDRQFRQALREADCMNVWGTKDEERY